MISQQIKSKKSKKSKRGSIWTRPTFIPEHGVLLVLFGSFLTGAALAQQWTYATTLALICAFFALLVEHPYVVQIKLRKKFKPRYVFWAGVYGTIASGLAIWLAWQNPVLIWLYILAIVGLIIDGIFVVQRQHKSIVNEMISFMAICLASPLAYGATTGNISLEAMAMWLLNSLFFCSAIYTIKLRRRKTITIQESLIYHCLATVIIFTCYCFGYLSTITALAFAIALIKLLVVFLCQQWYCQSRFYHIALFETRFALLFVAIASISVLPAHLPTTY